MNTTWTANADARPATPARPSLVLREIRSEPDLRAMFALRYQAYLLQGTMPENLDRLDLDPYDSSSRYLGAFEGDRLVGAARMVLRREPWPNAGTVRRILSNCADPALAGLESHPGRLPAESLFDLAGTLADLDREGRGAAEFGRTVSHPEVRQRGVGSALVHGIHALGLNAGVSVGVGTPLPHLVAFYERLGCRLRESAGVVRYEQYDADLYLVLVDLEADSPAVAVARRTARRLLRHGSLLVCPARECLEAHDHQPGPVRPLHRARRTRSVPWLAPPPDLVRGAARVELHDETLRDGLQSPSVTTPPVEAREELLHLMAGLGIEGANLGLPGAGRRMLEDVARLASRIRHDRLPLKPTCAGRTHRADIEAIAEASQIAGVALEAGLFLGCSPIRMWAEGWTVDHLLRIVDEAIPYAVSRGLEVMFVTEDTVRSHPDTLARLYRAAVERGARRICLCDTVGYANPGGVRSLVRFLRSSLREAGLEVPMDWHGHRDRGLAVANSLAAVEAGVDRVHGTALGVGERVGNTPMEVLLWRLAHLGGRPLDEGLLRDYGRAASRALRVPLPPNWQDWTREVKA